MRAFEISLFVGCVCAAAVLLEFMLGSAFGATYFPSAYNMVSGYNLNAVASFPTSPTPVDYFFLLVTLAINSIVWSGMVILTFITLAPWLMTNFHFPWYMAVPIHVGAWFLFVIALAQIWRGTSIDIMR